MWVCRSKDRIKNLQESFAKHPIAPAIRFALFKPFDQHEDVVTDFIWQTADGQQRRIYEASGAAQGSSKRSRETISQFDTDPSTSSPRPR